MPEGTPAAGYGELIPDPLTAALADMQLHVKRFNEARANYRPAGESLPPGPAGEFLMACMEAAYSLPAALAAVRWTLGRHRRSPFPASMGEDRGKHYCLGCTTDVDHHILYVLWPCEEYRRISAAILGEETPKPAQALPAVTVAVWAPGCGQPVCQHHYPARPDGCVCPAWSDGGGYHIISESPTCTAHQVPGEEATTDG